MVRILGDDRERAACFGIWLGCAAAVVALLLPWSEGDGLTSDAFGRSGWVAAFALVTVAGVISCVALHRSGTDGPWARVLIWVTTVGAVLSAVIAFAVAQGDGGSGAGTKDGRWAGPGLLIVSLVGVAALAHQVGRDDVADPRTERPGAGLRFGATAAAAAGLVVAVVGLFVPWERLRSDAIETIVGSDSVTFSGPEVPATRTLRWVLLVVVVLAGLAAGLAAARPAARRTVLPAVLGLGGVCIVVVVLPRITADPLRGIGATVRPAYGPWLTLAGGVLAIVGAVVAVGPARRDVAGRAVIATATAVLATVIGLPLAATPHADSATPAAATRVLTARLGDLRLGGSAAHTQVDEVNPTMTSSASDNTRRSDVIATPDGTFFTTSGLDGYDNDVLIQQVVHGRTLPVTMVTRADDVQLLTVAGGRAVLLIRQGDVDSVQSIDLHTAHVPLVPAGVTSDNGSGVAVLLSTRTVPGDPNGDGYVSAKRIEVTITPDGGAYIQADRRLGYRVSATSVDSPRPWQLTRAPMAAAAGPGPMLVANASSGLYDVSPTGLYTPLVGNVSDARCTLSRDPLSTTVQGSYLPDAPSAVAVDRAGDVWFLLDSAAKAKYADPRFDVLVRTRDGVLRRLDPRTWRGTVGLAAMPDGSLLLTRSDEFGDGPTYRLPDPAATARTTPQLGPIAAGCVSDNRVHVHTLRRPVTRIPLAPLPPDDGSAPPSAVLDARGTRLYVSTEDDGYDALIRQDPNGHRTALRHGTSNLSLGAVVADGRGGAWWVETDLGDQPRTWFGRVDASGRVQPRVAGPISDTGLPQLSTDSQDSSLWWSFGDVGPWHRTAPDGRTTSLGYAGSGAPAIHGGRGYFDDRVAAQIYAVSTRAAQTGVLGGDPHPLALPVAVAKKVPPDRFASGGTIAVAPDGDLLLHQANYLARVARDGRVALLSDRADGLPFEASVNAGSEQVIGDRLVVYDGVDTVYTVDVS